MAEQSALRVNDRATVLSEYATENRFLARRLTTWAALQGPLVEDAAINAVAEGGPERVLDVGCGTGDFTERLQRQLGIDLIALDLSHRMTELARARGLSAIRADVQALPFADQQFDCILANRVLYHLPDLDRGLAEIARALRPDGTLVAVTYSNDHLRELWDVVGESPMASTFSAENGAAALGRHFNPVERRDCTGNAQFASTGSILSFLRAYGEFSKVDLASQLGDIRAPFDVTYRHSVFLAHKPAR